jgi:HK97 family phage major capsid protein
MSEELTNLENTVHEYRKTLDSFAARTGAKTHHVEIRGSGEEREKIARIDADLDAVERMNQDRLALRAAQERLKQLEEERSQPQFRGVVARADVKHDLSSPEYAKRWLMAVARGDAAEMRNLATSTSGAGIPTDMERRIVEKMYQANVLRSIAPVSSIDSKRTITVEGALPTSALVVESVSGTLATITPSSPTFGTAISVTPYKYVCATQMSQEFIEDAIGQGGIGSGLDWVASRIGLSLALKMEEAYTVGTGSSQPEGIAGSSAEAKLETLGQRTDIGGAVETVTADHVIDTVHLVAPQYRNSPRFRWLLSDTFVRVARKLKNSVVTSGSTEYIWTQAQSNAGTMVGGAPGLLYGVPYSIGQYVPTANTDENIFAVVGDFNYFEIFDRTGMTSLVDPYSAAVNHIVTLYTYARTDSKIMLPNAFAAITA